MKKMKKRIADIVADYIADRGITDVFSLVGGGAMFLNDAFGHNQRLKVTYTQHEQACSMAAEGYVRECGRMAAVCVTTGPGGTNAITGVLGAYQDNYPMIVISGQVRYPTTAESTGLPLRFMGEQEHDIVTTVKNLTKYAVMIKRPEDILYELEKALYIAEEGRPGPVWVDIPMDIQSMMIETDELSRFEPPKRDKDWDKDGFIEEIRKAKKPVILTGSAIRSTDYTEKFRALACKLGIPVLAPTYNADLFEINHPDYYGNFGIIGGRAGNFIMQNADLIIGMGCRMAFRQIGFNYESFSPNSRRMVIDADENELKKPTLRIDVPICTDIRYVIDDLLAADIDVDLSGKRDWLEYCRMLRDKYPVYLDKFSAEVPGQVNPYYFVHELKKYQKDDAVIVLGNSTIAAHVLQLGIEKPEQRIINNMNLGSMGYDLPAAVGAAVARGGEVTLITGDGSIMLNIQELMTVAHYKLPIKIFICCNGGYRGIVRSQSNMFGHYTGCTKDTGVEMPDFEKVAFAFNLPYFKVSEQSELNSILEQVYAVDGPIVCAWPQNPEQVIEPRVMNRRSEDGCIVSTAIDDLAPFLPRGDYEAMQFETWLTRKG